MDKLSENWIQTSWRPAIGVTYIIINICDFILFPVLWTLTGVLTGNDLTPWKPLTMDSVGVFHISFGAILGVSAWSRGKEKMFDQFQPDYRRQDRWREPNRYHNDFVEEVKEPSSVYRGERGE